MAYIHSDSSLSTKQTFNNLSVLSLLDLSEQNPLFSPHV